jgi:hypothetical protein
MQLNPGTSASTSAGLSVSATSLSFGEVLEGIPNTLPVTLTAGTAPVNISGVTVTGTGFSVSGLSTPSTLSPGQSATLEVQFEPTATGTVTGQLSVATNAQTGPAIVSLTGTGASHEVELSWNAPSTSGSVAGYHIYRSPSGAASYQLMNSSVDTQTTYIDPTVQSGQSYDYMVKSIDGAGVESSPSNIADVVIP